MRYYWFCTCGQRFDECGEKSQFCIILCCYKCGGTKIRAINRNVYSLWERIVAKIQGKKLRVTDLVSISEEQMKADFKRENPEQWKRENPPPLEDQLSVVLDEFYPMHSFAFEQSQKTREDAVTALAKFIRDREKSS